MSSLCQFLLSLSWLLFVFLCIYTHTYKHTKNVCIIFYSFFSMNVRYDTWPLCQLYLKDHRKPKIHYRVGDGWILPQFSKKISENLLPLITQIPSVRILVNKYDIFKVPRTYFTIDRKHGILSWMCDLY